jgi:hypothetical protein
MCGEISTPRESDLEAGTTVMGKNLKNPSPSPNKK